MDTTHSLRLEREKHNITNNFTLREENLNDEENYFVTVRGTCIAIYYYNKSQRDALFVNFILAKNSTCFGQIQCPSSGVFNTYCYEHSIKTPKDGQYILMFV